jgi:molybdopterin-guanine dinucleotide biosynthesis protein A
MRKLTLIFPMAGQGARFGYRFKPFLEVQGKTFIEAAFEPFRKGLPQIGKVYFIVTAEQERSHGVSARLDEMFAGVPFETVVLEAPTDGPAETLRQCLAARNITGPILVCDCDHAVDVDGLLRATQDAGIACAIPTWDLDGESLASWSVAAIHDNLITAVAEKALPVSGENFRGMIGCYYFADAAQVARNIAAADMIYISDIIGEYLRDGHPVLSVPITQAHFFGDPVRLAQVTQVAGQR